MSAKPRSVDDDELKAEIYATIRRLERLAKRLEVFAEEQKNGTETDTSNDS